MCEVFLADKASDDGSGIWRSKGTIQRHTELGESTVKRTINNFLKEGIVVVQKSDDPELVEALQVHVGEVSEMAARGMEAVHEMMVDRAGKLGRAIAG